MSYIGQVFARSCEDMSEIPDGAIQCCVTSPPYYGLRSYDPNAVMLRRDLTDEQRAFVLAELEKHGVRPRQGRMARVIYDRTDIPEHLLAYFAPAEIGLEDTVDEYVERLVRVFREVRRVLRDDGTLWLNLGDSYAGSPLGSYNGSPGLPHRQASLVGHSASGGVNKLKASGLKPKDLIGIPWRVAFALQADGWWLRSDIIWHKLSGMPSSVRDRCTSAHEYIFMLSKRPRYFFDADAIRDPLKTSSKARLSQDVKNQTGTTRANAGAKTNGNLRAVATGFDEEDGSLDGAGANKRDVWSIAPKPFAYNRYFCPACKHEFVTHKRLPTKADGSPDYRCGKCFEWLQRDSHFAVFPPEIPSLCIRAGTSEAGCCEKCGASRVRVMEPTGVSNEDNLKRAIVEVAGESAASNRARRLSGSTYQRVTRTAGFAPSCDCTAPTVPSVVLDPFMGSGTVAEVAESLGRSWTGYEINENYHALIKERTRSQSLFS